MKFQVNGTVVHHTNDKFCVSTDVTYQLPTFILDGDVHGIRTVKEAEKIARQIVVPMANEFQYEGVTVNISATQI